MSDLVTEWVDALKTGRRSALRIGELAYEFEQTPDADYTALIAELQERGVDAPSTSTISRHKRVFEVLIVNWQYDLDRLEAIDQSKLYAIAAHVDDTRDDPEKWLEAALTMTREELRAAMTGEETPGGTWPWSQERVIREAFETGAKRLYEVNAYQGRSLAPAFELAAEMFKRLPVESLKQLWAEAHGESTE